MKKDIDKNFDEFIQSKLEDSQYNDNPEEQWKKMAMALDKRNFFRFPFYRFYIVYLGVLLMIISGISFLYLNRTDESEQENGSDYQRMMDLNSGTTDSLIQKDGNYIPNKVKEEHYGNVGKGKVVVKKDTTIIVDTKSSEVAKDSVVAKIVQQDKLSSLPDSVVKKPIKRIKYITKRDTIIQVDTTRLRRKR